MLSVGAGSACALVLFGWGCGTDAPPGQHGGGNAGASAGTGLGGSNSGGASSAGTNGGAPPGTMAGAPSPGAPAVSDAAGAPIVPVADASGAPNAGGAGGTPSEAGGAGAPAGAGSVSDAGRAGANDAGGAGVPNSAPAVAFPGAEGFGRDSRGGRGGTVCHVTTLADSGVGSLRDCVSQPNRTVVFDVGGWINLASNLGVSQSNLTIAGQTAPGNGIGVRGRKFSIGGKHIVLRYMRIRRGIFVTSDRDDAMTVGSATENVIIDHCSVSFGTDETLSMPGDEGIGPRNLTLQWSIVAWGLQRNNHSAGSLFTSNQTTIHHTLWAFNKTRNPRCRSEEAANRGQGGHLDWVNNVIYGWNAPDPVGEAAGWSISHDPFILAGTSNGMHAANAVGNYFISSRAASYAFHNGTPNFRLYAADNILDGNANRLLDSSKTGNDMIQGTPTLLTARIAGPLVTTDTPRAAYDRVLASAGPTVPARDEADALLVSQVKAQSGILLQSELDLVPLGVGDAGYGTLPTASRQPGFDTDRDGMPDAWETSNGFDPANAADRNGDNDADGYTNLEEYLNSLVP